MKKLILSILLLVIICGGCMMPTFGDVKLNTDDLTECLKACASDTLWIERNGEMIPIVPSEYKEWILN